MHTLVVFGVLKNNEPYKKGINRNPGVVRWEMMFNGSKMVIRDDVEHWLDELGEKTIDWDFNYEIIPRFVSYFKFKKYSDMIMFKMKFITSERCEYRE